MCLYQAVFCQVTKEGLWQVGFPRSRQWDGVWGVRCILGIVSRERKKEDTGLSRGGSQTVRQAWQNPRQASGTLRQCGLQSCLKSPLPCQRMSNTPREGGSLQLWRCWSLLTWRLSTALPIYGPWVSASLKGALGDACCCLHRSYFVTIREILQFYPYNIYNSPI